MARRSLTEDGLFLLHTIGKTRRHIPTDPWIDRYIFPNGELPSLDQIAEACEARFLIEDVHNFGADYDRTLMAWHERFAQSSPQFAPHYGERFQRMWRYYLLACVKQFPRPPQSALADRAVTARRGWRLSSPGLSLYLSAARRVRPTLLVACALLPAVCGLVTGVPCDATTCSPFGQLESRPDPVGRDPSRPRAPA
ncbi:class I SAM-dependent methyltransferase [Paludibacterium denitrificans]|uniref:class I SAM-dependent methyltransferase n=1 Tax=Paludibacterium denitrificans TaxID=2675226 RepID=UPI0024780DA7|nr:class I SAM-dependent methyltransferase [Paludibacterium denitrificans]